jgi:hypothetical protein
MRVGIRPLPLGLYIKPCEMGTAAPLVARRMAFPWRCCRFKKALPSEGNTRSTIRPEHRLLLKGNLVRLTNVFDSGLAGSLPKRVQQDQQH